MIMTMTFTIKKERKEIVEIVERNDGCFRV